jgi:hypothetical protein
MNYRIFKWLGLVLILEAGLLHYIASQAASLRAAYLGYLLVAVFLGSLVAAVGIYGQKVWGWLLGCSLGVASLIGYVWNSTAGLPLLAPVPWLYPYAIVASAAEIFFILLALLRPWRFADRPLTASSRFSLFLPSILIVVGLAAIPAYRWDRYAYEVSYHHHVGSLDAVCSTPLTSEAELEERYGVKVSLVALSMMDGVVDVRVKVLDPKKAESLLRDQAALLVNQQFLVLAPHVHQHYRLKKDKVHNLFFPTADKKIQTGSQVSLVFGPVRVEPVTVK